MFLTHVAGVELMASLVHTKRVGLILDLDATLLESEMLDDTTKPANWCDSAAERAALEN